MPLDFNSIETLLIAVIGGSWALWHFRHTKALERIRQTTDLFNRYNDKTMVECRARVWIWVDKKNDCTKPFRYSDLWTALGDSGNIQELELFTALSNIGSFWYQFLVLHRKKLIDQALAKELFGYQFYYWKHHMERFARDTEDFDKDRPEVLEPFRTTELEWLFQGREDKPFYKLRSALPKSQGDPPDPV